MSSVPLGDDQMPDDHESMKQEKNAMLKPFKRRDSKRARKKCIHNPSRQAHLSARSNCATAASTRAKHMQNIKRQQSEGQTEHTCGNARRIKHQRKHEARKQMKPESMVYHIHVAIEHQCCAPSCPNHSKQRMQPRHSRRRKRASKCES